MSSSKLPCAVIWWRFHSFTLGWKTSSLSRHRRHGRDLNPCLVSSRHLRDCAVLFHHSRGETALEPRGFSLRQSIMDIVISINRISKLKNRERMFQETPSIRSFQLVQEQKNQKQNSHFEKTRSGNQDFQLISRFAAYVTYKSFSKKHIPTSKH